MAQLTTHILDDSGSALCGSYDTEVARMANGSPMPGSVVCGDCQSINAGAQLHGKKAVAPAPYTPPARAVRKLISRPVGPRTGGTTSPKVSFITCSFNRPDLLRECVQSLLNQTDPNWEQLICDDASTDPRVEEVLSWAEEDPRIRVWRRTDNIDTPSVLWNFLIDRAHGEFISILDDDNEKLPLFVEKMTAALDEHLDADLVTCGVVSVDHNGRRSATSPNMRTSIEAVDEENTCDGGAMLYRRSLLDRIGAFTEAQRTGEDWDLFRRALRIGKVYNMPECYATYRAHNANRMIRRHELGMVEDTKLMMSREIAAKMSVQVYGPPKNLRTPSQRDALNSIESALASIDWVVTADDGNAGLGIIVMPFQIDTVAIADIAKKHRQILLLMLEDPSAVRANLNRVRVAVQHAETWVCTNDAAAVPEYVALVNDRVIVCPFLGVDSLVPPRLTDMLTECFPRDIDVLFCGHSYPSRKRLMNEVLPALSGKRVVLVGDGWEGLGANLGAPYALGVEVIRTQNLSDTYALHMRAKTVICAQRKYEDLFNGSVYQPQTVNRGFMEGYFGPRVFIDSARPNHPFDPGDVFFYDSPQHLIEELNAYLHYISLGEPTDSYAQRFARKCRLLYTYKTRMTRVLNCIRSPRFLAEIP